jgi:hypothetical protein
LECQISGYNWPATFSKHFLNALKPLPVKSLLLKLVTETTSNETITNETNILKLVTETTSNETITNETIILKLVTETTTNETITSENITTETSYRNHYQ